MKKTIRLTESDLHRIIKESVNKVLREDAFDVPSMKTWSPHAQKMMTMFDNLKNILNEIAKYASQQGIYNYTTPDRGHIRGRQYDDIKKTIENMMDEADAIQNAWGQHLYRVDKDYKTRPEFQLPKRNL